MGVHGVDRIAASLALLALVQGCGGATQRMQPGVPLEIHRGYCFVSTEFKQRGREVNYNDALERLSRYERSRPYLKTANTWAVVSIFSTIVATGTLTAGILGAGGDVKMDEDVSTALIATGVGVGVLSWVACITADGKQVRAAEVYNEGLAPAHAGAAANNPGDGADVDDKSGESRAGETTSEPP